MKTITINENYEEKYGFSDPEVSVFKTGKGLNEEVIRQISEKKKEPSWMLELRLKAFKIFKDKPMPTWGADLSKIDFENITYYIDPSDVRTQNWEDLPDNIRKTFDKLGIPEAEKKFLGGAGGQYDSEVLYHKLREDLEKQGVIFMSTDEGLQKYPELFKRWFGKIIPANDNKFAALNTAVWSGGSFIYVPKNVKVNVPLQAYFRINTKESGQFERTLIIADEGAEISYIEGCSSPIYSNNSLHSAVVELVALKDSKIRYITIQNWSSNVYNLVTKRAHAYENAEVEWLDSNLGCLAGDTKIFINSGIKDIKDINPGDIVFSLDENFNLVKKEVLAKKFSGRKMTYKLKTSNRREIIATPNHPFMSMVRNGKHTLLTWKPLEELKIGDLIAVSGAIPDSGESYTLPKTPILPNTRVQIRTPEKTNEDFMWFLGFYIGDGYLDKDRVCISLTPEDKSYKKLKETITNLFKITKFEERRACLRLNSKNLMQWIINIGLNGNANQKRIPKWVYTLPKKERIAFIEGYIDADGYIRKGHKNISITSSNKKLLLDTKFLAMTCDLDPMKISKWTRIEKKPLGKEEKEYTHYFLYFGEKKLTHSIAFVRVSSIEKFQEKDTWDIEIDGIHNFVANGILVHNSYITMKYPSVYMLQRNAKARILSVAFASDGQHQDAGAKALHLAPNTSSTILSKSISKGSGKTTFRGLVKVSKGAKNSKSHTKCDAILLDKESKSDTIPSLQIDEEEVNVGHEATVGKVGEDQLFYLMSRGFTEQEAITLIVSGFFKQFVKELPMEYAIEFNRLIEIVMENEK